MDRPAWLEFLHEELPEWSKVTAKQEAKLAANLAHMPASVLLKVARDFCAKDLRQYKYRRYDLAFEKWAEREPESKRRQAPSMFDERPESEPQGELVFDKNPLAEVQWEAAKEALLSTLNKPSFDTWIQPVKGVGYTSDGVLVLQAESGYGAEWLNVRLRHQILAVLEGQVFEVVVRNKQEVS